MLNFNTNTLPTIRTQAFAFLKKNKLLACFLILTLIPLFFFFFTSLFPSPAKQSQSPVPTVSSDRFPATSVTQAQPETKPSGTSSNQPAEDFEAKWQPTVFSEQDYAGFSYEKTSLPDGAISYTFPSDNPNRPNITLVKNNVEYYSRMLIYQVTLDAVVKNFGKPDYVVKGSKFWGDNAITYIYFTKGIGYAADPQTKVVYEQFEFKPVAPNDFKKTYGDDLIGELTKP